MHAINHLCTYAHQTELSVCFAQIIAELECGPMPKVMVALSNTADALCSTPQSLANAHYLTAVQ